ncbi:MAG: hydrolase [Isosphaeraceae bacterium]
MSQPYRLTAQHAALLVIDVQEKLLAKISGRERLVFNTGRLIQGAQLLGLPTLATEQYPRGLGPTEPTLAALIPDRPEKTTFNCCGCPRILETLHGRKIRHVTLAGIEAHICVAQTALELLSLGFIPQVAADAVASRSDLDRDVALHRIARAGAIVSSTEAILFEWAESADHPQFKALSALVK